MKYSWAIILLIIGFSACEKTINIEPSLKEPLLVVDASIEDGRPPMVVLSKTLNFFSRISPELLAGSVVRNATVTLSDGTRQVPLQQYTVPIGGGYSLVYYSTDTTNPAANMVGQQQKRYTLQIRVDNQDYTAVTTIPKLNKKIDSLWWQPVPNLADTNQVALMCKATDPVGFGDYIRYWTRVNRGMFLPGENSVFDDQVVDGTTYNIQVEQGKDRNNQNEQLTTFTKGDTVTVKFANIDKATYDFWRTVEFGYQSIGNPFASPVKVLGNVSNGALGAFSGYAVQYISLIIPK